jgi:hypothetical protein
MTPKDSSGFEGIEKSVSSQKRAIREISGLAGDLGKSNGVERDMAIRHIDSLKKVAKKESVKIVSSLGEISVAAPMPSGKSRIGAKIPKGADYGSKAQPGAKKDVDLVGKIFRGGLHSYKKIRLKKSERETLKRLKRSEETTAEKREKKPNFYISLSNKLLSEFSAGLIERGMFKGISINLIKSNMEFLPKSYVSMILFTTLLSFIASVFIFAFFLFFSFQAGFPFIAQVQEPIFSKIISVFWILLAVPLGTFSLMYMYPSLERGSIEGKINQELPFATINMAAISGSMIDPTKLFEIIISTKEYPSIEKEFGKIINGVNVLGYDLISVLRNVAFTSPSKKLADLFNGIATTINTGGDLPKFFDERAKSLLFEYNLEKEKSTKAAETFMDIYISVVIAAPMILMLLLIIMQVSGLGFSLTTRAITIVMVLGVSLINAVFLAFLHIKQSGEA